MKLKSLALFVFLISCVTVDESGRIIEKPFYKKQENNKWNLNDISLGPRWTEKDQTVNFLIVPREENLPDLFFLKNLPEVKNQGRQASSTAFATGYLAMSMYIKKKLNKKSYLCSPSFIYNLLNNGKDEGIDIYEALLLLKNTGCPPIEYFAYKDYDYKIQPNSIVIQIAKDYKINDFVRIDPLDIFQIASFIKNEYIIITTIYITENFLTLNKNYYEPEGRFHGKHTLSIVGYDLKNQRYYLFNSFGKNWGEKGYVWISKQWYDRLVLSAYIILR